MTNKKYSKNEMKEISGGIAAEMKENDIAEFLGENGKSGDQKIQIFKIGESRVASTNGDPFWEENSAEEFGQMLIEEKINLY